MDLSLFTSAEGLRDVSLTIGNLIGCVGVLIIFVGSIRALWLFIKKPIVKNILLSDIRIDLGHYLALGLEFLIAKDVIETLAEPTWEHLGKLAIIIALRSALTMFLAHEVKEVREELEEEGLIRKLKKGILRRK